MKSLLKSRGFLCCLALCGMVSTAWSFEPVCASTSYLFRDPRRSVSYKPKQQPFCISPARLHQNDKTKLNAVLSTAAATVDVLFRNYPYAAAGLICGVKASAADTIAQQRQFHKRRLEVAEAEAEALGEPAAEGEVKKKDGWFEFEEPEEKIDLQRNFAYVVYGALYQGMTQELVYNHWYPVVFGAGTDVRTVLTKVCFDLLLQTTLVTLPVAYISKALLYRYSFREAIRRYVDDIRNHGLLFKYWALWGPVQCLTFSVVPEHFRVAFIAVVSFFWLIILSSIASKTPVLADDECMLEDGQTCNIDG